MPNERAIHGKVKSKVLVVTFFSFTLTILGELKDFSVYISKLSPHLTAFKRSLKEFSFFCINVSVCTALKLLRAEQ
jgi:hypothetical protein